MEATWATVVWSGFAATVLSAAVFWAFRSFEWTRFSPSTLLGCLFFEDPTIPLTETVGFVLLVLLGSTVVPAAYGLLMGAVGGPGWGTGVAVGALHGVVTTAALPWAARATRCVRAGFLTQPGHMGLAWGRATPASVVVGHAVYGAILGGLLGAA